MSEGDALAQNGDSGLLRLRARAKEIDEVPYGVVATMRLPTDHSFGAIPPMERFHRGEI